MVIPLSGCLGSPSFGNEDCSQLAEDGIALSFDDKGSIESWNGSIEFFEEHGVVATFYVDRWHYLNEEEIVILHRLQDGGHEIGIHTMNHSNYFEFIEAGGDAQSYLEIEVLPSKQIAEEMGFEISTFAYPHGARDVEIDDLLLNHFTVLRGINSYHEGTQSWDTGCEDGGVFRSISPTSGDGKYVDDIIDSIKNSEGNRTILAYGHGIEESGWSPVSFDVLESFIVAAEESGKNWLLMKELGEI